MSAHAVRPTPDAGFGGATFTGDVRFDGATFTKGARLDEVVVVNPAAAHVWPDGWRLAVTPAGTGRLIREETDSGPAEDA
ncbi:pentapeptide repeat-containing protein [Streptosporangium roseum]|uniref:pentapeptide repeat-containing protein n=1 Tax=Streptosporangium roseum TaxID=2001 RepID=UPI0004CCBDF0|nr:pentapeptide repeat-containing protein [Streptosporangium roseum]